MSWEYYVNNCSGGQVKGRNVVDLMNIRVHDNCPDVAVIERMTFTLDTYIAVVYHNSVYITKDHSVLRNSIRLNDDITTSIAHYNADGLYVLYNSLTNKDNRPLLCMKSDYNLSGLRKHLNDEDSLDSYDEFLRNTQSDFSEMNCQLDARYYLPKPVAGSIPRKVREILFYTDLDVSDIRKAVSAITTLTKADLTLPEAKELRKLFTDVITGHLRKGWVFVCQNKIRWQLASDGPRSLQSIAEARLYDTRSKAHIDEWEDLVGASSSDSDSSDSSSSGSSDSSNSGLDSRLSTKRRSSTDGAILNAKRPVVRTYSSDSESE